MKTTRPHTQVDDSTDASDLAACLSIAHHPEPKYLGKRLVVVDDASVFIQRQSGAFDDERISRQHAEIHADEDGTLWIRDCGSRNGTLVNGASADRRTLLDGDVIGIGKLLFVVHHAPAAPPRPPADGGELVGVGYAHATLFEQLDKVADRNTVVVISGASGTGKTSVARELHRRSKRKGALVMAHCGAISDDAVHSELFGHTRGAFPGATTAQVGLLEAADEGTLVLDDVDAATRKLQLGMLQFLDSGDVRRVGSTKPKKVSTRVVVTTDQPLEALVQAGKLERDFADRLSGFHVEVPPLSDRLEDVGPLAHHFARKFGGSDARLDPDLVLHLLHQKWPGNVRELQAFVEEAVIDGDGEALIRLPSRAQGQVQREPAEMIIDRAGTWFEARGGERIELGHRKNLARILQILLEQREAQPGVALSVPELVEAGWPGDKTIDKSGANRVYVALTTLRRLGLRDVITRERDGYCIPKDARIDVVPA